jgi:ankyrin repeat protein
MDYNKNSSNFQMELISNGQYLFKAIKAGDIPEVIKFIDKNKYLVAYKDDFNQIPLHICAKRNLYELIYFLVSRLSSIDSQDLGGRTPLMIAAKNNFFEFATILLFEGADPTIKDAYGNKASQMTNNENLRIVLRRGEVLYNLRYFYKGKNFHNFIENGLDFLLKKELDIDYEPWLKKGEKIIKEYC